MNSKNLFTGLASVSLFTSSLFAQCPSAVLHSSSAGSGERFGVSLDAFAGDLLIGASGDDAVANNAGAVYRFQLGETGYAEVETWHAFDAAGNESFGSSLALGDGLAVVGAAGLGATFTGDGAAYVYERSGTTWSPGPRLLGSTVDAGDSFGHVVALTQAGTDRIAVGAPHDEGDSGLETGTVTIFERSGGSWIEVQVLQPSALAVDDRFGSGVDLEGDRLIVGAPGTDSPSEAGAVYVFEHDGTEFVLTDQLLPSTAGVGRRMGASVALEGDRFVAGATGPVTGRAYVFEYDSATGWSETTELFGGASSGVNFFGESVAFEGSRILIGATGQPGGGAAFLFEHSGGTWSETANPMAESTGDYFGRAVTLDSGRLIVGASVAPGPGGGGSPGAVYQYETEGVDCNANGQPDACDIFSALSLDTNENGIPDECECATTNYCTSDANSTGLAATIEMLGSTSIADNDVVLRAAPVPNQPGIFYYGPNQVDLAFGNGRRCVGGQVFRLPVVIASGGVLEYAYDLTNPPQAQGLIAAGSQWNFQAWYRDPAAGGAGFDLSDGLSVSFCP